MLEFLGAAFGISVIVIGVLSVVLDSYKKDYFELEKLNYALLDNNKELSEKNKNLWFEINNLTTITADQKRYIQEILEKVEIYEFPVGSKVSWIDRKGDIETGVVIDDSKLDGVTFVHLRRVNQKGKVLGGIITVPANKLKLEN